MIHLRPDDWGVFRIESIHAEPAQILEAVRKALLAVDLANDPIDPSRLASRYGYKDLGGIRTALVAERDLASVFVPDAHLLKQGTRETGYSEQEVMARVSQIMGPWDKLNVGQRLEGLRLLREDPTKGAP